MAKQTEQRILVWLNQFDDSLQDAWDVPRENSLPGIADAIGVVRSALHTPLKNLQLFLLLKNCIMVYILLFCISNFYVICMLLNN